MSEQTLALENDWIIETLLVEAHSIIYNHSKALIYGLCKPEDGIRIAYPPPPVLQAVDIQRMTQQEVESILSGQLSAAEISAIKSMNIDASDISKRVLEKVFIEYFSALMVAWLNFFDGIADPRMVEATDLCAVWLGARILSPSQKEDFQPKNDLIDYGYQKLQDIFSDTYYEFNDLVIGKSFSKLKVYDFKCDEIVIKTLLLEAYCEIEIKSRQLIQDLASLNLTFVYPLNVDGYDLTESEKQVIRSLFLEDVAIKTTLKKVFAAYCYDIISMWLSAFKWNYSSVIFNRQQEQQAKVWRGARIAASGYRYSEMLHDTFYKSWHEFNRINSLPPQRPF